MSDIGLHFDGLMAFLAVLAVDGVLLLGFAVCVVIGWMTLRRTKVAIRSQPIYGHIVGTLACMIVVSCAGLVIYLHGLKSSANPLEAWLDRWLLLWLPPIFLLWPVSTARTRRWQGRFGQRNFP